MAAVEYEHTLQTPSHSNPNQVEQPNYQIDHYKQTLHDLLSARVDGLPVGYGRTAAASRDLQQAITSRALEIFDDSIAGHAYELEALGFAGEFIEQQVAGLTTDILNTCGLETTKDRRHVSVAEQILDRYIETCALEQTDSLDADKLRILISDAGISGVLHVQREVITIANAREAEATKDFGEQTDPSEGVDTQQRKRGLLDAARLALRGSFVR